MNILNNSFSGRWVLNARRRVDKLRALIAQLFGNGEQGAMYIPKPQVLGQQVLWQDVEGTVPVESDGDPIGLMLDLSGNGNHASQSVSAERPVFPGVEYDGVDDRLLSIPSTRLPIPFTVAVKFSPYAVSDSNSGAYRVFSRGHGNSTRGAIAVNAGNVYINLDTSDGFNVAPVMPFDEVTLVVRFLPESTVAHIGGQEVVESRSINLSVVSTSAAIGAQTGDGSRNFEGKIGPLIVVDRDVGPEVADRMLEYLSGVTL